MGPNHVEEHPSKSIQDNVADDAEGNEWQGFADHRVVSGSESSDEESSATDGETDRYAGYQCLPTSEAPHESEIGEERNLSASIMKDFQEALDSASDVHLSDYSELLPPSQPAPIELTEEKIKSIKEAMSKFTLPAPPWAMCMGDNLTDGLRAMVDRLRK